MKVLTLLALFCLGQATARLDRIVNCYWDTSAYYRAGAGQFLPSDISYLSCTHISYSFFGISVDGEFKSLDPWLDFELGFIKQTVALKPKNPFGLKILAAVGGWNEGSVKYSNMAADPKKRALFVSSTLSFIQQHGFDGLDLHWEYPGQRGGPPEDKQNFVTLLREIKQAFAPYGYELSIAAAASEASANISYDIPAISEYVDFINLKTYNYHMASDGYLGFSAPLPEVQASLVYWLNAGASKDKLVLGIDAYGHSYQLADSSQHKPGDASVGPGIAGPYTATKGFWGYNEICVNNLPTVFDSHASSVYAFQGDQWIGFDDRTSLNDKLDLIWNFDLGGAMLWTIDTDDFRGLCGQSYPLLSAITSNNK